MCDGRCRRCALFEKSCRPKKRHDSRLKAEAVASKELRENGRVLEVYKCDWCRGFHLGHTDQKQKKLELEREGLGLAVS